MASRKGNGKTKDVAEAVDVSLGVNIEVARATLGKLVSRAGFGGERIPISRHGELAAFLVGLRDIERLRALDVAERAESSTRRRAT